MTPITTSYCAECGKVRPIDAYALCAECEKTRMEKVAKSHRLQCSMFPIDEL